MDVIVNIVMDIVTNRGGRYLWHKRKFQSELSENEDAERYDHQAAERGRVQNHQTETDASGCDSGRRSVPGCRKEIYYRASKLDPGIGTATVYRMVNKLEEIGAISRKNMYKISCGAECDREDACTVEFDDNTVKHFSAKTWNRVILAGLKAYGYVNDQKIRSVEMQSCM